MPVEGAYLNVDLDHPDKKSHKASVRVQNADGSMSVHLSCYH